jgi:hypothetical protein
MAHLTFTHPLGELLVIKGLEHQYLYELAYKYVGTTHIHDKREYHDVTKYDEILNKTDRFVCTVLSVLKIMNKYNTSEAVNYNVIAQYYFNSANDPTYSFVEPVELREELVFFLESR